MDLIRSPIFECSSEIRHAFFTRQGGVSTGIFSSLNVGFASGDSPANVIENRNIALTALGLSTNSLVNCFQIHSSTVVFVEGPFGEVDPRADGMVTNRRGIALGIFAADCVPILFSDMDAGVIGAAHVGWKGAYSGIVENLLAAMCNVGATMGGISAAVGPSIHQNSYEVGKDVYDIYVDQSPQNIRYFKSLINQKWLFDLKGFVADLLERRISRVWVDNSDTYTDEERFFSARRSAHRGEVKYGRMLSAIALAN